MLEKISLEEAFSRINECWKPRIAGEVNDTHIKLAKLNGAFVWHHHENEDEMFLVISGKLLMRLRDGDVILEPGEFIIIPNGVEHLPIAEEGEVCVMLIEPKGTLNTGNVRNERTVAELETI